MWPHAFSHNMTEYDKRDHAAGLTLRLHTLNEKPDPKLLISDHFLNPRGMVEKNGSNTTKTFVTESNHGPQFPTDVGHPICIWG